MKVKEYIIIIEKKSKKISTNNTTASSIGIFLPFCGFVGYLGISYFQTLTKKIS
jgi:hypothetical protein